MDSSDCVVIPGRLRPARGFAGLCGERWEWLVEGDVPLGWRSWKMNGRKTNSYRLTILLIVCN